MDEREKKEQWRERQRQRVVGLASVLDRDVWSKEGFPEELRPDLGAFINGIKIILDPAETDSKRLELHPAIPEQIRSGMQRYKDQVDSVRAVNNVAFHEPDRDTTYFMAPLFVLDDAALLRVVAHEAAESVFLKLESIKPTEYDDQTNRLVLEAMRQLEVLGRVRFEDTVVEKMGFRRLLMADGYGLADLWPPELVEFGEAFATGYEIVSEQIKQLGSVGAWNRAVKRARAKLSENEDHVKFAREFFTTSAQMGWREVLAAFAPGDFDHLRSRFESEFGDKGDAKLNSLYLAIHEDEELIAARNARFLSNFI